MPPPLPGRTRMPGNHVLLNCDGVHVLVAHLKAGTVRADPAVQLRYVQPAVLRGELNGLAPWSQYNPHGVFIALKEAATR